MQKQTKSIEELRTALDERTLSTDELRIEVQKRLTHLIEQANYEQADVWTWEENLKSERRRARMPYEVRMARQVELSYYKCQVRLLECLLEIDRLNSLVQDIGTREAAEKVGGK